MSFFDNIMDKIRPSGDGYFDDGYDDSDFMDEEEGYGSEKKETRRGLFSSRKIIEGGANLGMQVITIKPSAMEDSKTICDSLLDGKAVILNMEGIGTELAQRIIDFTLGSVYAIEGNLQMVTKYIFVASPMNVELSGDFIGDFASKATNPAPKHTTGNNGFTLNA